MPLIPPGPPFQKVAVHTYYNRIIQQCISDLYVMNKLIYMKAKPMHAILDNGKNIA